MFEVGEGLVMMRGVEEESLYLLLEFHARASRGLVYTWEMVGRRGLKQRREVSSAGMTMAIAVGKVLARGELRTSLGNLRRSVSWAFLWILHFAADSGN